MLRARCCAALLLLVRPALLQGGGRLIEDEPGQYGSTSSRAGSAQAHAGEVHTWKPPDPL